MVKSWCILFHDSYFKLGVGTSKRQDKPLPDPNGPLSSTIAAAAIWDANDVHTWSSQQILGERKWSQGSYVELTPVQQAHTAKYALANGNKVSVSTLT